MGTFAELTKNRLAKLATLSEPVTPLPPNVDPATTHHGCRWRDFNGRPVDRAGNVIDDYGPSRFIALAPVSEPMPKAYGVNWHK